MARTTRPTQTPPAPRGRPPARAASRAAPPVAKGSIGRAGAAKAAAKPSAGPTGVAKSSKDELRAQVEKLERANALLRTKSREATRAAKAASGRIAELEEQVAALEGKLARTAAPARRGRPAAPREPEPEPEPELEAKPERPAPRPRRRRREIDPGDAVPEGVAVAEPEPLDEEAQEARDNLEEHLR